MLGVAAIPGFGFAELAVLSSTAFFVSMFRVRAEPTARPLLAIAAIFLLASITHLLIMRVASIPATLNTPPSLPPSTTGLWRIFTAEFWVLVSGVLTGRIWLLLAYELPLIVGTLWFLFTLHYTGRHRQLSTLALTVVAVVLALFVGSPATLAIVGAIIGLSLPTTVALAIAFAETLALTGIFLSFGAATRNPAISLQSMLLPASAIIAVLLLPFTATILKTAVVTPITLTTASVLFTVSVASGRLFGPVPSTTVLGRDHLIDELADGVIVTGMTGRIHSINPQAATIFDLDHSTAPNRSIDEILPEGVSLDELRVEERTEVTLSSGHVLALTTDTITDRTGQPIGSLLFCRDITANRRRAQRLAVLTQLIAGVTRTKMATVADAAATIQAEDDTAALTTTIEAATTTAANLTERIRELDHAVASQSRPAALPDIRALVMDVADRVDTSVPVTIPEHHCRSLVEPTLVGLSLELLMRAGTGPATTTVEHDRTASTILVTVTVPGLTGESELFGLWRRVTQLAASEPWTVTIHQDSNTVTFAFPRVRTDPGVVDS